jgi:hypothetical protein
MVADKTLNSFDYIVWASTSDHSSHRVVLAVQNENQSVWVLKPLIHPLEFYFVGRR